MANSKNQGIGEESPKKQWTTATVDSENSKNQQKDVVNSKNQGSGEESPQNEGTGTDNCGGFEKLEKLAYRCGKFKNQGTGEESPKNQWTAAAVDLENSKNQQTDVANSKNQGTGEESPKNQETGTENCKTTRQGW